VVVRSGLLTFDTVIIKNKMGLLIEVEYKDNSKGIKRKWFKLDEDIVYETVI
jgi:hypothetical protein